MSTLGLRESATFARATTATAVEITVISSVRLLLPNSDQRNPSTNPTAGFRLQRSGGRSVRHELP